jgi:RNA polymerase sigma factor (sigma-70 family)
MDDPAIQDLLARLRAPAPLQAWADFLERYSPLLLGVVRLFEHEEDQVADCYLFVCEQLSRAGFRRLLRFRPDGPAHFTTWLCAVARNLCLDWHRHEVGRHRVFASVARLSALDQEIFRCLFVELLPVEEAFLELRPVFSQLTIEQVSAGAVRIQRALTPRQRWLLGVRRGRAATVGTLTGQDEEAVWQAPSDMPSPETWAELREERKALHAAVSRLPRQDRLLLRLRFEHELTLAEIARLQRLENAQAADRRIRVALERLRASLRGHNRRIQSDDAAEREEAGGYREATGGKRRVPSV